MEERDKIIFELTGALLKALPRKPKSQIARLTTGKTITAYHCGNCGSMIFRDQEYCPKCGQKVRWEEE